MCTFHKFWILVVHISQILDLGGAHFTNFGSWWCTFHKFWILVVHTSQILDLGGAHFTNFGSWWCTFHKFWILEVHISGEQIHSLQSISASFFSSSLLNRGQTPVAVWSSSSAQGEIFSTVNRVPMNMALS